MTEHDVSVDDINVLKAQLAAAARQPGVPLEKVHGLVCALVDMMKSAGAPPEKVIIAVKEAIFGGTTITATFNRDRLTDQEQLLDQAVVWCIKRYYGSLPNSNDT